MRSIDLRIARSAAAVSVVVVTSLPTAVLADTAGPDSSSGGNGCSVEEECPDTGVTCSDDECVADAEEKGLELRCEDGDLKVYCDPEESSGCATAAKPGKGAMHVALATFVVATTLTAVRARRRATKRR